MKAFSEKHFGAMGVAFQSQAGVPAIRYYSALLRRLRGIRYYPAAIELLLKLMAGVSQFVTW